MKNLLFALVLLTVGMMSLTSCGDDNDDLPVCIQTKLDSFEEEACPSTDNFVGGNLVIFEFRSETVYCFNWGSCRPEKSIEIWSETCGVICNLGGETQETVCDGVPWDANSEEVRVVFQK